MKREIIIIKVFVLKLINVERKMLTYQEIIHRISEQIASVCKESEL